MANTRQCLFWSLEKLFHVVVDHHKKVEIMIAFITTIKDRGESRSGTYCIGGTKDFYGEIQNELSSDDRNRNFCSKGKWKKYQLIFETYVFHPDFKKSNVLVVLSISLKLLDTFFQKSIQISIFASFGKCLFNPNNIIEPRLKRIISFICS